jgi:hypothetical protein
LYVSAADQSGEQHRRADCRSDTTISSASIEEISAESYLA